MTIHPHIAFRGQCEAAFKFYEQCLGGHLTHMMKYGASPMADQMPAELRDQVIHARLVLSDGQAIMGADAPPDRYDGTSKGMCINIGTPDPAEAERVFHALSEGATVQMPIGETFWAIRFGMLIDQFGIPWMVNCEAAPQK